MPHFNTEHDMLDAMGGVWAVSGYMRPPGNLTKAERKQWDGPPAYKWHDCGCRGMPGNKERGDYHSFVGLDCKIHANVKGNFPPD